jgi:hypothetical protein
MTLTRSAVDSLLALLASLAWSFAVFAFGARWVSPLASGLLALAFLASASVTILTMHLRDRRLLSLSKGACPRCGVAVHSEHRHRRWDATARTWLSASTGWDCDACGYSQTENWPCPECPSG